MSNKRYEQLNDIDRRIRQAFPEGMIDGTRVTIEFICGFELFNTRPYHNYETWSDGWRITAGDIKVEQEDLDDAVDIFLKKVEESKNDD